MIAPGILLSVVIPTYNYGHLLGRVLDSVLSQLTDECELVVIDDGSSDETPKVLETISAGRPSGFRWLRQNNAGAAAARNAGLRASRGSHVLFLDADDQLLPGALAAICSAFRDDSRATVVIGGRLTRWPDGREKRHPPPRRVDDDPCRRVADHLLDKTLSVSHGAVAVARELVDRRPYPEAFRGREDIPVSAYWLACGRIKVIDIPLVRIHKHPDSLRHAVKVSESLEQALADEIFRGLPDECQKLKPSYLAQRYLALSRAAAQTGERSTARRHLLAALRADPGQLLARGQLRKLIKAWMGSCRRWPE
ncbi:MAG: glycosyltransferase family 2 protein [Rhodocyclaceae bacterium]|nr:glycosyltransferase family 2 protein [Rhodocyclaceae bacterium]MBK6677624.1 glycosyltransferase family 2 protein [Rhodocyclaceae bacterium]MBK9310300.1 glycosyltransferase family 2 protein [Rhodocyclaceae bacterium]